MCSRALLDTFLSASLDATGKILLQMMCPRDLFQGLFQSLFHTKASAPSLAAFDRVDI